MTLPEFSEFAYGYALTRDLELQTGGRLFSPPVFPNLRDEGKADGGWDVKLKSVVRTYYLQFKIPQCMAQIQSNSKEFGKITAPSYRMHLHKHKTRAHSQHNALVSLAVGGCYVAYASPVFHTQSDIESKAKLAGAVIRASAFFDPRQIGKISNSDDHFIAYSGRARGVYCSEPVEIDASPIETVIEEDIRELQSIERDLRQELVQLFDIIGDRLSVDERGALENSAEPALLIAHLARMYLNCEVFFLSTEPTP